MSAAPVLRPVVIGLLGPGLIGKALLAQISEQAGALKATHGIDLQVLGIANSRRMLLADPPGLVWKENLEQLDTPADLDKFAAHVNATSARAATPVLIDCTASDAVASQYAKWMSQGISVVTANKRLGSGPLQSYRAVQDLESALGPQFLYEASVGAGLPILSTLKTLLQTGDAVQSIVGVLSGTLSYIFNDMRVGGRPFSQIVAAAKEQGFTEPDPRDDLSGMDVARKVVILARECGLQLELQDVAVESLVPGPLQSAPSAAEFMQRLPEFDGEMQQRVANAATDGRVLRYVGVVDVAAATAKVSVEALPLSHPFAQLAGSDNAIAFTTRRYAPPQPLVVRGPGAGAQVTAAGVFGDLLQLARCSARPA